MKLIEPREEFDKCIIAVSGDRAIYDRDKIIHAMMNLWCFDHYDDALDYFYFNIFSAFAGDDEEDPIFAQTEFDLEGHTKE